MPPDGLADAPRDPTAAAAAVADAPAAGRPAARVTAHPEGNVKDTVESILVAFILAFVFRAFVVEAFVIPTGSMAPTLLGAHMRYRCADCGYDYVVNFSASAAARQGGPDLEIPSRAVGVIPAHLHCPNCGYEVPENEAKGGGPDNTRTNVAVHYGDRILVLKYRYLFGGPRRWDVVVFKSPDAVQGAPLYTTNYIKRLIGNPGESVMILDGDVYVSTAPPPPPDGDAAAREAFLRTFKVQRKPAYAQDALWRNVYDNDYVPHLSPDARGGDGWRQPWRPAADAAGPAAARGWDVGQSLAAPNQGRTRAFRFDDPAAGGAIEFDPDANPDTHALTDFLAYDQYGPSTEESRRPVKNLVGDLRLGCLYKRESGDGAFHLSLTKRNDLFVAQATPGQLLLARYDRRTGALVKQYGPVAVPDLDASAPAARLELANVDFRASVRVNGREVLATGDEYGPDGNGVVALEREERTRPEGAAPRPQVRLRAERQRCAVEHVTLSRDVFYINGRGAGERGGSSLLGNPDRIVSLGPDEYFTLGDNSLISGDGRMWSNDVRLPGEDLPFVRAGRVPGRFLLGKAFFVYWPAGHRPLGLPFGLVPNFGEMRFIH